MKPGFILGNFGKNEPVSRKNYRDFVEKLDIEAYESPLKSAVGGAVLGSPDFIDEITETHLNVRGADKDIPALRHFSNRPPLEEIIEFAREAMKNNEKQSRQVCIYLCHKHSGAPLKEIAVKFDVGVTAIGEANKRIQKKMEEDTALQKLIGALTTKIN